MALASKRQRTDAHITPCTLNHQTTYWESPEAIKLFGSNEASEDAKDTLQRRVKQLQSVNETEDGWRNAVDGRDPDNLCSRNDIFEIRQRSALLCCAYQLALDNMNEWTWKTCCTEACSQLNRVGITQAKHHETVAQWNIAFRKHNNFPHPNPRVQCGKHPVPKLFEKYPEAHEDIVSFAVNNLATLTVEAVHEFVVDKLIPKLFALWEKEEMADWVWADDDEFITKERFLKNHGLTNVSITTIWRWLHRLGFSYDARKKSFYVDGHEREDVVAYRREFCKRYLTVYEPRCLRWVQLRKEEAQAIDDIDFAFGHSYLDTTGAQWIEFHADYCRQIPEILQGREAKPSIRASPGSKPLMIVGQDESVFTQFLLGQRNWVGPKGERPLLPKSEVRR